MTSNGYQYVKGFLWSQIVTIEKVRDTNPYVHKLVINMGLASSAFLKPQCS